MNGKTILIWFEQGIGDTITWSSCLSYISSQAEHCILECQEKLVPLLKRSFPNIEVKAEDRSRDKERDDFDFHLPMGSLYKNLSEEILQKTKVDSYLIPNQERVDYWKKRLNSLGNGPYVGVSWKSTLMTHDRIPNYASIFDWFPLFKLPNIKFINLQPTDFEDSLKKIKHELGVTVHNFDDIDHWNNLDDVAALCNALDMVVSTKTTVPYISAGVGTLTKLANWKQSSWNNILLNPRGPLVQIYERNTWETWDNVFISISDDILKLKDFKYQKENNSIQNPPPDIMNEISILFNKRQFSAVIEKAHAAIEKYPKAIDVWNLLGAAEYQTGMLDKAIKSYKRVISIKPDFAAAYNNLSVALRDKGDIDEAIEVCKKAISIKPDYAQAYNNLGNILKDQHKTEESVKAYEECISIKPDYVEAYNNLGNVLKQQEKIEESIKAYKMAISLKPDFAQAYNNLGNILNYKGKSNEAIKAFEKALLLKPNYDLAFNNLGLVFLDQGKLNEAIKAFEKTLLLNPDYADAYNNLGKAQKEKGKSCEAFISFKKALQLNPYHAYALNNLGSIFRDQGKIEDAVATFQKAVIIKPDFALAFNNLGVSLKDQGRMDEAIDVLKKEVSLKPNDSIIHKNLSYLLLNKGIIKEGFEEYEWRWKTQKFLPFNRNFKQPIWNGKQKLHDKIILIWCEQGIGDTLT